MRELPVLAPGDIADVPLSWPIVEHRVVGQGKVSTFVSDTVATPQGESMVRDYLQHSGAVGIIALDDQERVVVVRQYRHPVGFRLIEPPAGLLDAAGETWLAAAERELAEEALLAAGDWRVLTDYLTSPGCLAETLRIFLARDLRDAPRPDGFELHGEEADMDVCLVPLEDLVTAVLAGTVQNPTLVAGSLAAYAALRSGRVDELRAADAPWLAREAAAQRAADLAALDASA